MKYLNALNTVPGVGSQKIKKLLDRFGDSESAWKADLRQLEKSGIGEQLALRISEERSTISPDQEWEKMKKEGIEMLTINNEDYPELLKEIPNPPYILYRRGSFNFNSQPALAIVGSRKFSRYGDQVAYGFAQELSRSGITVVSGMALGIDAIAHRAALDAGGKTVAILGSDLTDKNIGPRNNFNLSRNIIDSGLLMSDYPINTPAGPGNFPARNRIMAGMTLGTLVIEAAEGSGSLITANLALEFNREVFAVPGPIFSLSSIGTNNLIKSGAKMATSVKDILEELNIESKTKQKEVRSNIPSSKEEEVVLKILSHEPTHVDNIVKNTKLDVSVISSTLAVMEMKGVIKDTGGQNYVIL